LLPALGAWTASAATLGWTSGHRAALAVGLSALAAGSFGVRRVSAYLGLTAAAASLAVTASAAHEAVRTSGPLTRFAADHAVVRVTGVVTSDPMVSSGRGRDGSTVRLSMTIHDVTGRGQIARVGAPVLVQAAGEGWSHLQWRQEVRAQGRLSPVDRGDSVVALLRAMGEPEAVGRPGPVPTAAEHLRAGLRHAAEPLPPDARGLLPALVIGDTSRTPDDLTEAMLATGMTHLSAVSGSNVAIVLAFAVGGASLLGVRRPWRPVVAVVVLAGFVVLARPEPSVVRAATMGAIGLLGLSRSRRAAGIPVLSAAVLALLVVDPWLGRSFGFALSTLATLGLLVFTRSWGNAIGQVLPRRIRSWGPALAIPVAAQAMCAPVVVLLQGTVSAVGVLANLLAAPLVAPATVSGVAAAVVAPVWPAAATLLCWLGGIPALGIAWIARTCAALPGGTMPWPDGPFGAVLLAVITAFVLLTGRWWWHGARTHPVIALGLSLLVVAASAPTSGVTWPPDGWRLVACDVGQGDALVVATTPGHAVLVDAGPEPAAVNGCLRRLGVRTIDSVVLTHFHADHIEGLPGALDGREVREILASPVRDPPHQWKEVVGWASARGIPIRDLYAGDHLSWHGVTADVWWPARRIAAGSVPNNASAVLAVRAGPVDALLMGDVEREAAHAMLLQLRRNAAMAAQAAAFDVVKTPHHGSANLDEDLMAAVAGPVALISVGEDNDYGHPSPKHLEVLRRNGYAVFRTDQRGDIAVVADGDDVAVTWRRR
jgi:competence protein ComEC